MPETPRPKTDKEKLKEAGMLDLHGGLLTGGGIMLKDSMLGRVQM